jgi:RNA polymerase sigma-70 factor (ECF subfamily)
MLESSQQFEFVRLWMSHGQRVYAYILTLTCNDADADEIYQEVGMTLWKKFDQFTPGTNFRAWAQRVALNKVLSFRQLRRHSMILCSPEFFDVVNQQVEEDTETLDTQHQAFADCYRQLPPRHKELIEQRYRPGATTKSVAAQTGRTVPAVYQALRRIHNVLFDCVDKLTLGGSNS